MNQNAVLWNIRQSAGSGGAIQMSIWHVKRICAHPSIVISHNLEPNATSKHSTKFRTLIHGSLPQILIAQLLPRGSTDSWEMYDKTSRPSTDPVQKSLLPWPESFVIAWWNREVSEQSESFKTSNLNFETCHLLKSTVTFHAMDLLYCDHVARFWCSSNSELIMWRWCLLIRTDFNTVSLMKERELEGVMTAPDERSHRLLFEDAMVVRLRALWEASYGGWRRPRQPSFTIATGRMSTPHTAA